MALIDKKLTDLTEKLSVPDDAFIHIVDVSDTSQSPEGSSYKARKSTIGGTVKAQTGVSGTVKTNSNSSDPIVYLKSEVDSLVSGKQNALGFTPENVANKQSNLDEDLSGFKYPNVTAVKSGLSTKADITALNLKADKSNTYTKLEVDNLIEEVDLSTKENTANKQNSLVVDGTGVKFPTVDAVRTHTTDTNNPHAVTKAQIGLSNVDNTSDLNKPISTATQTAIDDKINGNGSAPTIALFTGLKTIGNSVMIQDLNGNIGVGTATPFNIAGFRFVSINAVNGSGFSTAVNSTPAIRFASNATDSFIAEQRNLPFRFLNNGIERFRLAPTTGNALFNKTTDDNQGVIQANGNITASAATLANQVVIKSQLDLKSDLASPALTGTPTAPTATAGTNTTQIATTAFVLANSQSIPQLESNATDLTVWNNGKGNVVNNTSFGDGALKSNTTGQNNTAFGHLSLNNITTNSSNTAVGRQALQNSTVSNNTGIGNNSLGNITTGSDNTALGNTSGHLILSGAVNSTGSNSVFLGSNTRALNNGENNQIVIGEGAVGAGSNTATLGNASITKTVLRGVIQQTAYTVATLPAGTQGMFAYVTDALAPTYMATVAGGGAIVTPVFYNGTNWIAH